MIAYDPSHPLAPSWPILQQFGNFKLSSNASHIQRSLPVLTSRHWPQGSARDAQVEQQCCTNQRADHQLSTVCFIFHYFPTFVNASWSNISLFSSKGLARALHSVAHTSMAPAYAGSIELLHSIEVGSSWEQPKMCELHWISLNFLLLCCDWILQLASTCSTTVCAPLYTTQLYCTDMPWQIHTWWCPGVMLQSLDIPVV